MCPCVFLCMFWVNVCLYVCLDVSVCVCLPVYVRTRGCVCAFVWACLCVSVCLHTTSLLQGPIMWSLSEWTMKVQPPPCQWQQPTYQVTAQTPVSREWTSDTDRFLHFQKRNSSFFTTLGTGRFRSRWWTQRKATAKATTDSPGYRWSTDSKASILLSPSLLSFSPSLSLLSLLLSFLSLTPWWTISWFYLYSFSLTFFSLPAFFPTSWFSFTP